MKTKYLILLAGVALALPVTRTLAQTVAVVAATGTPAAPTSGTGGIIGSAHDFSKSNWTWNATTSTQAAFTCQVCHTPHKADTLSQAGMHVPLWGHQFTGNYGSYLPFTDPTGEMNAATGSTSAGQPSGISLACLSCHDGTVAVNQMYSSSAGLSGTGKPLGGTSITSGGAAMPSWAVIAQGSNGTNMQGTHPISITYPSYTFLQPTTATLLGPGGGAPVGNWPTPGTPTVSSLLYNGKVECASCHDVHNQIGDAPNDGHLLKIGLGEADANGAGDLLCRSCHIK